MKKLYYVLYIVAVLSSNNQAQIDVTSVNPSAFITLGDYSNQNSSKSVAGYVPIELNYFDYLTFGVERLVINNPDWDYTQYALSAGYLKNLYPFYLSLNYMYLKGDLEWKPPVYSYTDKLHYLGAGIIYNYDLFYVGASFNWMTLDGYRSVINKQYELKLAYLVYTNLTLLLKPMYSELTDGRNSLSVSGEIAYRPFDKLKLTASGFIGDRVYYYNPDLMVIFNQHETQKNLAGIKATYSINSNLKTTAGYQYAGFDIYSIRYYTMGISVVF